MSDKNEFQIQYDAIDQFFGPAPVLTCADKKYYRAVPANELVIPVPDTEPKFLHPLSTVTIRYRPVTDRQGARLRCYMNGHSPKSFPRQYDLDYSRDAFNVGVEYLRECGHADLVRSNHVILGALHGNGSCDHVLTIGPLKTRIVE